MHWPPGAWREMGWFELQARWRHLTERMDARARERRQREFFARANARARMGR